MFNDITPVILTLNEEANIPRCLERLCWARNIVVVDSFSTDRTVQICNDFENVKIYQRRFDSHSSQWQYAISGTEISTKWILALDADYILTDEFIKELASLEAPVGTAGFSASFRLCLYGKPVRSAFYPPVTVLYRKDAARYVQDGHTQRVVISGAVDKFSSLIHHDDRKPLEEWLFAQRRYSKLEAAKLQELKPGETKLVDRIRKMKVVAPFLMPIYCLFWRRGILDGWEGIYYAFQRTLAEIALALYLTEASIRSRLSVSSRDHSDKADSAE